MLNFFKELSFKFRKAMGWTRLVVHGLHVDEMAEMKYHIVSQTSIGIDERTAICNFVRAMNNKGGRKARFETGGHISTVGRRLRVYIEEV